jgi:thymidine phosphorylase
MASLDDRVVDGAAHYAVRENGDLAFLTDGNEIAAIPAGEWIEVEEIGERLAENWPPDDLDYLMHDLAYLLGVRWGHTGASAKASDVASELFNNEEALMEAAFGAVGAPLGDKKLRGEAVDTIRRWFRRRQP